MEVLPKPATVKNPPERFAGDVWLDVIATPREAGQQCLVAKVRFAPGAHTAWHRHARGQTLHVLEGIALLGQRDGTVLEVYPGQTVYTPAGEEHWHGAAPGHFMAHLAITENGDDPDATTTWLEHVDDAIYHRP